MNGTPLELFEHNRRAWDRAVREGHRWTIPVAAKEVAQAREGHFNLLLTPRVAVPHAWFGRLPGTRILALASGGGQQGPILAAAGARVTVLDASGAQLERDHQVAEREGLELELVQGDMASLDAFGDACFDLIFHPVSNCFIPRIDSLWRECARVLIPGGVLLAGFANPLLYLFDDDAVEATGRLELCHHLPYSDLEQLDETRRKQREENEQPLEFGHTLSEQIGGQLRAGFVLTDLYEDDFGTSEHLLSRHSPVFIATRARKKTTAHPR